MQKRKRKFLLLLLGILVVALPNEVFASCDYKTQNELKTASANVDAKYEIKKIITDYNGVEHPEISEEIATTRDSGYMKTTIVTLNIVNITNDLYFKLENTTDNIQETHYANDLENGVYKITVPDVDKIREYKITIYTSKSDCLNEELRTITIKTPKFNEFSGLGFCENSDKYYCQEYITEELNITEEEIINKEDITNLHNQTTEEEQKNVSFDKKKIVLIICCLIVLTGLIIFVYTKNKDKKLL